MKSLTVFSLFCVSLVSGTPLAESDEYKGSCPSTSTQYIGCATDSTLGLIKTGDPRTANLPRCRSDPDYWVSDTDTVLSPTDVTYNASVTFSSSTCVSQSQLSPYSYTLKIGGTGAVSGTNRTRSQYDKNPIFIALLSDSHKSTPKLDTYGDLEMQSSVSKYEYGQPWTITTTKNGDGYDVSGSLTTHRASTGQFVEWQISNCPPTNSYTTSSGYHMIINDPAVDCNLAYLNFTGNITPTQAKLNFKGKSFGGVPNPLLEFSVTANWVGSGPKLVTTGSAPATDGKITGGSGSSSGGSAGSSSGGSSGSSSGSSGTSKSDAASVLKTVNLGDLFALVGFSTFLYGVGII